MKPLNFPSYQLRFKEEDDKTWLFCHIRRKYMVSGPEEIVRQHLIHFLIEERAVPRSLISLEKQLIYNERKRRTDLVVYDKKARPILLAECKAPEIAISQDTFEQVSRYNMVLGVPILVVTNGLRHFVCRINLEEGSYAFISDIPTFENLQL